MPWAPRHAETAVRDAVAAARSAAEAVRLLGLRSAGRNDRTLRRLIEHYGISTAHWDPLWTQKTRPRRGRTPLELILVENSTYHRGHVKQRLYDEGLKDRRCELCGQDEIWHGDAMALILDHVNGVATDNRLENLRIVCPNCAATLDTHCGRKNRIDRDPRLCLHCDREFRPRYASQRYCSRRCGTRHTRDRRPKPESRKVPWPSYEQLQTDMSTMSMLAIGRKYGVSDNAVRKWLRAYERERATPGEEEAA